MKRFIILFFTAVIITLVSVVHQNYSVYGEDILSGHGFPLSFWKMSRQSDVRFTAPNGLIDPVVDYNVYNLKNFLIDFSFWFSLVLGIYSINKFIVPKLKKKNK